MKAAIVELRNNKAAALLADGTVVIIPNRSYALGQEIEYGSRSVTARKIASWAAGAAAVLCIGFGAYAYQAPYSYVSLDVNPSIEYTLNRFDQVLRVAAVNTDAQAIVTELYHQDISHRNIAQAVELTITSLSDQRYFEKEGGSYVLIAAASKNTKKTEQLVLELEQTVRLAQDSPEKLTVEAVSAAPEQVEEARNAGVTLGRKQVVDELSKNLDPSESFDYDEWLHKPVEEIVEEAEKQNKSAKDHKNAPNSAPKPEKTPKPAKEKDPENDKTPQPPSNENKGNGQQGNGGQSQGNGGQSQGNGGKDKPSGQDKNHGGTKPGQKNGKGGKGGGASNPGGNGGSKNESSS